MRLKRKCPLCDRRFWFGNNRLIHVFMDHQADIKRRLDAALEAFKNPPEIDLGP